MWGRAWKATQNIVLFSVQHGKGRAAAACAGTVPDMYCLHTIWSQMVLYVWCDLFMFPSTVAAAAAGVDEDDVESCVRPEEFIHIYVNQTEYLLDFLEFIVKVQRFHRTKLFVY